MCKLRLDEGLRLFEKLPRDAYFKMNQQLAESMWQGESLPTVGDIAQLVMNGVETESVKRIFEFFDNRDGFLSMIRRQGTSYDEGVSAEFIKNVMSSNNTDISESGYFYKLLMASADDFRIVANDCNSDGVSYRVRGLEELQYQYRVKWNWIREMNDFCLMNYGDFLGWCEKKGLSEVHVRSPLTCTSFPHSHQEAENAARMGHRGVCRRCAGYVPERVTYIGAFTTLMVTENVTQGALDSMNKGRKRNINTVLMSRYDGPYDWESIKTWVNELTYELTGDKVFSRFYEIALMSRIRFDEDGPYVASFAHSMNLSGNSMGAYVFKPTDKHFVTCLRKGDFLDDSLKMKIAMNRYERTQEV